MIRAPNNTDADAALRSTDAAHALVCPRFTRVCAVGTSNYCTCAVKKFPAAQTL